MYKYAQFDLNIHVPCGSRVMIVFDLGRMAGCPSKPRPSNKAVAHASGSTMLTSIRMHNLIKICLVVQEI